jgi:hypothetical protein
LKFLLIAEEIDAEKAAEEYGVYLTIGCHIEVAV